MLCSSCSAHIRPIVALDIDGTLGDYHTHLLNFLDGYFGKDTSTFREMFPYKGVGEFGPYCCEAYDIDMTQYRQGKLAFRQGGLKRTMPLFNRTYELVLDLRTVGAEVWLCTTRPYQRLDNVDPDTREWLSRHSIEYDGMLYDEDKYQQLAGLVDQGRVVGILDDLGEQYDLANAAFPGRAVLRVNSYNAMVRRAIMVGDLQIAADLFMRRIVRWYDEHR